MFEKTESQFLEIMKGVTEKEVVNWVASTDENSILKELEEIVKNAVGTYEQQGLAHTKIAYISIAVGALKSILEEKGII